MPTATGRSVSDKHGQPVIDFIHSLPTRWAPIDFIYWFFKTDNSNVGERRNELFDSGFSKLELILDTIYSKVAKQKREEWILEKATSICLSEIQSSCLKGEFLSSSKISPSDVKPENLDRAAETAANDLPFLHSLILSTLQAGKAMAGDDGYETVEEDEAGEGEEREEMDVDLDLELESESDSEGGSGGGFFGHIGSRDKQFTIKASLALEINAKRNQKAAPVADYLSLRSLASKLKAPKPKLPKSVITGMARGAQLLGPDTARTSQLDLPGPPQPKKMRLGSQLKVISVDHIGPSTTESHVHALFDQYGAIHSIEFREINLHKKRKRKFRSVTVTFGESARLGALWREHNETAALGSERIFVNVDSRSKVETGMLEDSSERGPLAVGEPQREEGEGWGPRPPRRGETPSTEGGKPAGEEVTPLQPQLYFPPSTRGV
ncbi:hypothetical protein P7C70_g6166, partial [Phenoliferia sp. Uapishka_3]